MNVILKESYVRVVPIAVLITKVMSGMYILCVIYSSVSGTYNVTNTPSFSSS